jgi:hypothetical protein
MLHWWYYWRTVFTLHIVMMIPIMCTLYMWRRWMTKDMPEHVAANRVANKVKRTKPLRGKSERSEFYDVFRRIDMHNGDKDVCWEWRGAHGLGTRQEWRPRVAINNKHYYVYRVVYQLYTGHTLAKHEVVRHKCDHSWCCNPHHMLVGTQVDNVADMLERERVGIKHFHVKRIMEMLEIGCTAQFISKKMREGYDMQIDPSMVNKIRMRTVYRHIPWPWGDNYATQRRARLDKLRSE